MAGMLPNGPLQVVFSFDTTGSMSSALTEVRGRISEMLQRLQADVPGITTAVVAHGDYCDRHVYYLIKHVDFTDNLPELVDFVNNVGTTGGGDTPEAYEVMLRLVRKDLKWTPGSQRVLVVIGDAYPHPLGDPQNTDKIDWEEEVQHLADMGVRIYAVQVDSDLNSTKFFKTMAEMTDGQHLKLSQFSTLCDVIMAICYREKGAEFLQNYEAEVRAREGRKTLHRDLEGVFGTLKRADSKTSAGSLSRAASLTAAPSGSKGPALAKAAPMKKVAKPKTAKPTPAARIAGAPPVRKAAAVATAKIAGKKGVSGEGDKTATSATTARTHRKLKRELVPENYFRFNQLHWSPWKLVAVPSSEKAATGPWRSFLRGAGRVNRGAMFVRAARHRHPVKSTKPLLCEVAVQTRPGARRHVVWFKMVSNSSRLSLSKLLASPKVRAQLDRAISNGCRVWVRWAKLGRRQPSSEVKQQLDTVYDYAWCGHNGSPRDVYVSKSRGAAGRVKIAGNLA